MRPNRNSVSSGRVSSLSLRSLNFATRRPAWSVFVFAEPAEKAVAVILSDATCRLTGRPYYEFERLSHGTRTRGLFALSVPKRLELPPGHTTHHFLLEHSLC